jgi:hypothetical protein
MVALSPGETGVDCSRFSCGRFPSKRRSRPKAQQSSTDAVPPDEALSIRLSNLFSGLRFAAVTHLGASPS